MKNKNNTEKLSVHRLPPQVGSDKGRIRLHYATLKAKYLEARDDVDIAYGYFADAVTNQALDVVSTMYLEARARELNAQYMLDRHYPDWRKELPVIVRPAAQ